MLARHTKIDIGEYTAKLERYITAFKYSDTIKSEADTAEITLADNEHKLLSAGVIPAKNSALNITIVKNNWNSQSLQGDSSLSLPLGSFELDKLIYKGVPTELILKLTSVPSKKGLRGVVRNKAWENTTLNQVAADIAGRAGLKLFYDAENIEVERVEQNQPDLPFLKTLCKNNGLNLKIADGKLIIFDIEKYEKNSPVITLSPNLPIIKNFNFEANSADIYSGANVNFLPNGISDLLSDFGVDLGDFGGLLNDFAGTDDGGDTLNINEHIATVAEGERLKKSLLHEKNKNEWKVRFTLSGSFSFLAGNTFQVEGYGFFNGRYLIESSEHNISNGYTTNVTAYRVEG